MNPKEMVQFLKQNGFHFIRQKGSHIIMYNEKTRLRTTVPMHNTELKKGTEIAILKQAGLK